MGGEVLYFISDTHLGDGTGADRFRYPGQLLDLLGRIEDDPQARLVLLGDFMELWAASLEAVMICHAPVLNRIASIAASRPVTYVVGNHDCLPWYYFIGQGAGNIQVVEQFTFRRGALVATHGHQYDPFNRVTVTDSGQVMTPWTRKLVRAVGLLERLGGESASEAIDTMSERLSQAAASLDRLMPHLDSASRQAIKMGLVSTREILEHESPGERGYPLGERIYEEAALGLMREGARLVLMGHTHHPLLRRYGFRTYVNTGSWVWDRYPPTYGRYAGGLLELINANTHEPYVASASSS